MLQRVRDEAHRFAINFHRSKRSGVMLESLLDEIPLLGEVRRRALLDRFGSVSAIKKATATEIAAVPGIAFGADDYIRISYATNLANIEKGLARMDRFVRTLAK